MVAEDRSESMSTINPEIQASRVEDLAGAEGECGHWPVDVGELGVPKADAATRGHFVDKSVMGVRSAHDYPLLGAPSVGVLSTNR